MCDFWIGYIIAKKYFKIVAKYGTTYSSTYIILKLIVCILKQKPTEHIPRSNIIKTVCICATEIWNIHNVTNNCFVLLFESPTSVLVVLIY